ncbi:unnamed protein product, partial [Musa textilis]
MPRAPPLFLQKKVGSGGTPPDPFDDQVNLGYLEGISLFAPSPPPLTFVSLGFYGSDCSSD